MLCSTIYPRYYCLQIFCQVTAKFDPVWLGIPLKGAKQILEKIMVATDVSVRSDDKTFFISGTLKQINDCHLQITRFLHEDQEIFAQLANLRLTAKDPVDGSPETKVIPINEVNSADQEGRVHLTIEAQWFQVDPYAFRFMERFYGDKLNEINGEFLVEITASDDGTRVILQAKQNCDPTRFNTACSELSELIKTVTQGMVINELDLKGADEDSAKVLMDYIGTMYPVIIDRPHEHGPFFVYGDAGSVGEARRAVKGGMSQQESYDTGLGTHEMALAAPEMISFETYSYRSENGVCISLRYGDITAEEVDAIVNPANEFLSHGAGLAKLIVQRGGLEIQKDSDTLRRKRGYQALHVGDAVHTVAGNLPCKFVIHAVGPEWAKHSHTENMKLLEKACLQSFKLASKLGLSSIAIPAISSGIFGAPIDVCAFAMLNAVEEYLRMATVTKKEDIKKKGSKQSNQKQIQTDKKKISTKPPKDMPSKTTDEEKERGNPKAVLNDIRFVLIDADSMDIFQKQFIERLGGNKDVITDDFDDVDDEHDDDEV